jgi:hypothetical protein
MSQERERGEESAEEETPLPQTPPLPELPEVPHYRPNLPPSDRRNLSEKEILFQRMGMAYIIPATLIVPIILLTLLGAWLDTRLGRSPIFTLIGAIVGFAAGVLNMMRITNKLNR